MRFPTQCLCGRRSGHYNQDALHLSVRLNQAASHFYTIMDKKKPLFFILFIALACLAAILLIYFTSESDQPEEDAYIVRKEYMIVGNSGIFKVEVREAGSNWQLLAKGLKSRQECDEIIDRNFTNRKR